MIKTNEKWLSCALNSKDNLSKVHSWKYLNQLLGSWVKLNLIDGRKLSGVLFGIDSNYNILINYQHFSTKMTNGGTNKKLLLIRGDQLIYINSLDAK